MPLDEKTKLNHEKTVPEEKNGFFQNLFQNSLFAKYPVFFRYFVGDFSGKVADQYFIILLPFIIFSITSDPLVLALALGCNAVGRIVMLPFGGVIIDRFRPQVFLFANNLIQAFGLIILLTLHNMGNTNLLIISLFALVFGLTDGISLPATNATVPRLVEKQDLLKANGLIQGLEQLTGVIGPVMAGLLIAKVNLTAGIIGALLLYILSAISYFSIIHLKTEISNSEKLNWSKDFLVGLKEVMSNPVIRTNLILTATTNIFVMGSVTIGFLILLKDKFGLGADFYGLTSLFFALGFVIGFPLVSRIKKIAFPGRLILLFSFLYFLIFIGFAASPNIWIIMLLLTCVGVVVAFDSTINNTWIQSSAPIEVLGRISSFQVFAMIAVDPVGQALAGFLAKNGPEFVFYVAGFSFIIVALINYIFNPVLRRRYDLNFEGKVDSN